MAKALMIQGTGSGVGKSLIVAGLCRIFRDKGINVAPFKSQNMALNSFITKEGGEIGRAQALQAEAAGLEPSVDMNPVLLKASGDKSCQVIMNGRVHSNMEAQEYYAFKESAWKAASEAYDRLAKRHDLIIIEGAGSPAEINLMEDEIVNMKMARHANAPVILAGDIDKGGVFASFYGTIGLLEEDAGYIKAFIVNKFRGDIAILKPALDMTLEKTGRPVIGVIPYLGDLGIHEEDGIPIERVMGRGARGKGQKLKVVVVQLRYISNFTDFDPFMYEPDIDLVYSLSERDFESADLLIIPGSKNTVKDLLFLRENGLEDSIKRAANKGAQVVGVCGGYQMLGTKIFDPYGIESPHKDIDGIGLLEIETTFERTKTTCQVEAETTGSWVMGHGSSNEIHQTSKNLPLAPCPLPLLKGYEIHMGTTTGDIGLFRISRITDQESRITDVLDGSSKNNVWGTYMHGIFDNDIFRRNFINNLRIRCGLNPVENVVQYSKLHDDALNKWAGILSKSIDMNFLEGLINV